MLCAHILSPRIVFRCGAFGLATVPDAVLVDTEVTPTKETGKLLPVKQETLVSVKKHFDRTITIHVPLLEDLYKFAHFSTYM